MYKGDGVSHIVLTALCLADVHLADALVIRQTHTSVAFVVYQICRN